MRLRIAIFLLGPLAAAAQTPQAAISGVVTDAQGAVIVGAEVTAANTQTGVNSATRSNHAGFYALRFLPVGEYVLTIEQAGFRRYERQGLRLSTVETLALDVTLEVGAITESLNVTALASTLETRTSEVGQLIESRAVQDLPLGDRRTMNLVNQMGAAVFINYDAGGKPNFSLAGGRTQSQMFWIDGGTGQNMRLGIGQIDMDPPVEVVEEVKILSSSYAAEYGGSAGGVIIATTKSGTNRFRGSLFEYLRNDRLDAANFFAPVAGDRKVKPSLRYNVFGGTIGGPIRRDRTFFFFGFEGSRRGQGNTRTLTVPAELQKSGDFSQTFDARGNVIPVYDPNSTRVEGTRTLRTQFAGNRIPLDRLDPVAANLLPFYPVANRPADNISGANNFRSNFVNRITRNNFTVKLDHNLGSKDKLSGRYLYNSDDEARTSVFPNPASETDNDVVRHQQYWYGSWTRVISSALIHELRFTYANRVNHAFSQGLGGGWPTKLGIRGVPDDAFPQITVAGMTTLGSGNHERRQFPIEQYQVVSNLSWVQGRHALKFGAEVRPSYNYEVNRPSVSGQFNFPTLPTGQPGTAASGFGLASLLVGFPTGLTVRETQLLDRSSWYLAVFAQDDWTVRRDLTLNLGLRLETDTPIVDASNRMNGFDAAAINPVSRTPGVVRFAGVNGWRASPYDTDWNNFGPRVGFAWKPFGSTKTVVRAGYGIFIAHPFDHGAPTSASLGFELSANLNSPDQGITAPFFLRNGVPGLNLAAPELNDGFGAVAVGRATTTAVTFFEPGRRAGYAQQFNFGVQRELRGRVLVEVSYLGNLSRKLPSPNLPINQIRPEILGPGNSTQRDRPFPQFSNVSVVFPSLGVSAYHAGVARMEKRFSQGFNLVSTYTWSKFLNNTDEGGSALGDGGTYSDFYNRRADRGPSDNDIRHRFTWSSVYELPVGKGRRFLSHHPARHILGEWGIGSVVTLRGAAPFTVTTQTNTTFAFSAGGQRADVLRNPNLPNAGRALDRWFDTAAFQQPANYRFGNQGMNILRGDGDVNFNFSILRDFPISEEKGVQFRGEFFNMFNHPNFGLPGHTLGGPGFGIVNSASPARRIQLGLRMTF